MFSAKEYDSDSVDEALISSFNSIFVYFQKNPLKTFSQLVNQKIVMCLCLEMDPNSFNIFSKNFLFDQARGILYAELNELLSKILELLRKSGISFKPNFNKDFDLININSLINLDKSEIKKFVNLIVLLIFNCPEKETFIDRISNFEEFQQQELLKIVERYMILDENTRESMNRTSVNTSIRNTITDPMASFIESEFTLKFMSRIDHLEKERDGLEKEKISYYEKLSQLEEDIQKFNKEKLNLQGELKKLEETNKNLTLEKEELSKIIQNFQVTIKELEDSSKQAKFLNEYKNKLEEKQCEVEELNNEIRELRDTYDNDVKMYQDRIEILIEKNADVSEMKSKYERMKEMIKDYDALKEKMNLFESMNKEFSKMKNNYRILKDEKEGLESLVKDLEEKLDENLKNYNKLKDTRMTIDRLETDYTDKKDPFREKEMTEPEVDDLYYIGILKEKDIYIKSLEEKIKTLEKSKEDESNKNLIQIQPEDYQEKEKKLSLLQNELTTLENENLKKIEEIEFFKKDNLDTKERYEKEFELMASSVYNLGLNYWSMKMDYAQKLSEKPNWLIKERQKYFNGDF
jgi:DNA repair exonuclease SbcCD ATPase subunit